MIMLRDGLGKYSVQFYEDDINCIAESVIDLILNSLDEKARTSSVVKCVLEAAGNMADCLPVTCASRQDLEAHTK